MTQIGLPDAIKQAANDARVISFFLPTDLDVGRRLSHFSLATAWSSIGDLFNENDRFGDLNETFTFILSLKNRWGRMSKLPTALLGEKLDDIATAAVTLANKIQANLPELTLALGSLSQHQSIELANAARIYASAVRRWGGTEEFLLRPTKPNAESAETTYCVKALSTFLIGRTGQTNNTAVGEIIGALLNLGDRQLTADLVSKLTKTMWLPV